MLPTIDANDLASDVRGVRRKAGILSSMTGVSLNLQNLCSSASENDCNGRFCSQISKEMTS